MGERTIPIEWEFGLTQLTPSFDSSHSGEA